MRQWFLFVVMFVIGIVLAVVIRTAIHRTNPSTTAPITTMAPIITPATAPMPTATAINSICAVCGMPVNPALGTAEYHGKRIGFGCATCPAKFAANPDKYGPAALANKVVSE